MLDPLVVAGPLDENAAHRERRGREEVAAAIPAARGLAGGHAKVGFVDERRRLQRLIGLALAGQAGPRESPEFVIDFGQHLTRRTGAAVRQAVRRHGEREL